MVALITEAYMCHSASVDLSWSTQATKRKDSPVIWCSVHYLTDRWSIFRVPPREDCHWMLGVVPLRGRLRQWYLSDKTSWLGPYIFIAWTVCEYLMICHADIRVRVKSKSKKTLFNVGQCKQNNISSHLKWVLVADKSMHINHIGLETFESWRAGVIKSQN